MFQLDFGILPKTGSLHVFMEKATAPDVLENFEAASKGLNKNKFTQASSDDPNVNLKFLELLVEKNQG